MAPPTVRSASAASNTQFTLTVTAPSGLTAGDLMIAWHVADNDGSLSAMGAPSGWTLLGSEAGLQTYHPYEKVWTKVATSSDVSAGSFAFTNTVTNVFNSVVILAITAGTFDTTTPTGAVSFQNGGTSSSTSHVAPSLTGVVDGLLCTSHGTDSGGTAATYTPPSGMTERADTNSGSGSYTALEVNTLALTSTNATGTQTATCTVSRPWKGAALIVNPVTGSGGGGGGGGGTVTFRAASQDDRGTSGIAAPDLPTGTQAGDLLLAVQSSDPRGTLAEMTAPSGWTEIANNTTRASDVGFIKVWQKTATASEPATYNFPDSTAAHCDVVIVALTGYDAGNPISVTPTWNSGAAQTTHPALSVNGLTGDMLITAYTAGTAGTTRSYTGDPTGMTLAKQTTLSTGGYILLGVWYRGLTADGATGAETATCSAATPFVAMSLVVQTVHPLTVSPSGIATGQAFGTPTVTVAAAPQTVSPTGIVSAQAFGTALISAAGTTGGFGTTAFGTSQFGLGTGSQPVAAIGIGTGEAFGVPTVAAAGGSVSAPSSRATPAWMVIGAASTSELATAKAAGATHGLVEVFWDQCQTTSGGTVDASGPLANIARVLAADLRVCLRVSLQYIPAFVDTAAVKFRRNGAVDYNPGNVSGNNARDWVWSASTRALVDDFLTKLFNQIAWSQIDRVQLGGGPAGELQYPDSDGTQWWGYSSPAQTGTDLAAGQSVTPSVGYVPSTGTTWTATDIAWVAWYTQSLNNWMLWLIAKYRAYYTGPIWVLHPGAGLRKTSQTPTGGQALNYRVNVAKGVDWDTQMAAYPDANVYPYCTWVDADHFAGQPYNDTTDGDAAPWYHLLRIARTRGRAARIWGENTGGQTNTDMDRVFQSGAVAHGYQGVTWLNHTSLSDGTSDTYANLTSRIATANAAWADYQRGVNMAGGEFAAAAATLPGTYNTDYSYDSAASLANVATRGYKVVRLPFRWERIQPTRGAALDALELIRLQQVVSDAQAAGMQVVLDVHNFARYINSVANGGAELVLGTVALPVSDLVDLWTRLSAAFKNNAGIYGYGLMNEPHDLTGTSGSFTGTVRYDWNDATVQGWTGDTSAAVNVSSQLRVSATANATGYWNMRKDDAGTKRNNSATGNVIRVKATLGSSVTGTWTLFSQWQTAGFAWQNPTSTTYVRVDTGATVSSLIAGVPVYVTSTFTAITSPNAFAVQVESNGATSGQAVTVDIDDYSQGSVTGALTGPQVWEDAAQQCVTAIRNNNDNTLILIPGYGWSGAQSWAVNHPTPWIIDPVNNFVYEAHYYFDSDNSGDYPDTYATEASLASSAGYASLASRAAVELQVWTSWLTGHGVRGFLGEVGWPNTGDTSGWNTVGDAIYTELDMHTVGATYWAAGARWGTTYILSVYVGATQTTIRPQATVIEAHLAPSGGQTVVATGLASVESFGLATVTVPPATPPVTPPDQTVSPTGIGSGEAIGIPVIATANGDQSVNVTALDSVEAFGIPSITVDLASLIISPDAIPSEELFGDRTFVFVEVTPPVPTGVDTYFIDGTDLTSYAWRIETGEGLQTTPGVVGDDIVLPGRDGAIEVFGGFGQQRRPDAIGKIVFSLWLKGVDPTTGTIPGGSNTQQEYFARWDELVRMFHRRRVTIDHVKADGSIRRAVGHLVPSDSITPARVPSSPWFGRFKATFAIPGAHWTDTYDVTTGQQSLTTGSTLDLSAFSGATAPCTELTVTFGSGSNPMLSTSWGFLGWNDVIASGRQLSIDTATGTTGQGSGTAWTPGYDRLTFSPGPRLFEIDPSEPLSATLTHTGGGTMTVEVSGKRRYRTS